MHVSWTFVRFVITQNVQPYIISRAHSVVHHHPKLQIIHRSLHRYGNFCWMVALKQLLRGCDPYDCLPTRRKERQDTEESQKPHGLQSSVQLITSTEPFEVAENPSSTSGRQIHRSQATRQLAARSFSLRFPKPVIE